MEHRWGERVDLNLPVEILPAGGDVLRGRLRDASISGCRVDTEGSCPLRAGTEIEILVLPSCALDVAIQIEGRVVRRTATGVGVEWFELSPPGLTSILRSLHGPRSESWIALLPSG